jgi:hypothetical protein
MKTMSSIHLMKWAVSTFVGIANAILPQHCRERTPGERRRQQRAVPPLVFSTRSSRTMRTSGEIMFQPPSAPTTLLTTGLYMIMLHQHLYRDLALVVITSLWPSPAIEAEQL